MHYFSNNFFKIAKRFWGPLSSTSLNFRFGDLKLRNLAKLPGMFFELKNISYDSISVTSSLLRYTSPKNVTKLTLQDFSILGTSKSKFLATPVGN